MKTNPRNLYFASWLRVFAMASILACHFTQMSSNSYLVMSSQFFNIGNHLFFILSGFLFGVKNEDFRGKTIQWYKKRLVRIFIPYEIMLAVLFLVSVATNTKIVPTMWLSQILGVQGWQTVFGAGQTWFISSLLICYLFTPLLSIIHSEIAQNKRSLIRAILTFTAMPVVVVYLFGGIIKNSYIVTPLFWYAIAYFGGAHYDTVPIKKRYAVYAFMLMVVSFAIRLLGKMLWDDTVLYDKIISSYTHAIGAFCILYIFAVLGNQHPGKVVTWLSGISFEIYLWHYMFKDGPVTLFGLTYCWATDCIVVLALSIALAVLANKLAKYILIWFRKEDRV